MTVQFSITLMHTTWAILCALVDINTVFAILVHHVTSVANNQLARFRDIAGIDQRIARWALASCPEYITTLETGFNVGANIIETTLARTWFALVDVNTLWDVRA